MANWILKAAVQKAISLLPNGHRVNYVFQKHVTKMRLDDALMDQGLIHCADHLRHFRRHHTKQTDFTTLEIGTGWYPVVPIGLFLGGAGIITTVDINPLLRAGNVSETIRKFREYHERGRLVEHLPSIEPERLRLLLSLAEASAVMDLEEIFKILNVRYLVADARRLDLPDAFADLIHSNDVFEHIYSNVLKEILIEFKRVAKRDGLMTHFIDMTDHFANMDKSISVYNFLKYTDAQWRVINNDIAPQNRLRLTEYRAMYEGLAIDITEEIQWPGNLADLEKMKLAPRFEAMRKSEVAVLHAYLISRLR